MKSRKSKKKVEPCCERCAYWGLSDGERGECRRYAPRPAWFGSVSDMDSNEAVVAFPFTYGGMWCGEFKASGHESRP